MSDNEAPDLRPKMSDDTAREQVAQWMMAHGFATGHGDTLDDLLKELDWQVEELRRNTRNRDMWKDQCERQAAHLTEMRAALSGMCMMLVSRPDMARLMGFGETAVYEKARAILNGNQPDQGQSFVRQTP